MPHGVLRLLWRQDASNFFVIWIHVSNLSSDWLKYFFLKQNVPYLVLHGIWAHMGILDLPTDPNFSDSSTLEVQKVLSTCKVRLCYVTSTILMLPSLHFSNRSRGPPKGKKAYICRLQQLVLRIRTIFVRIWTWFFKMPGSGDGSASGSWPNLNFYNIMEFVYTK
jgi:hypothetical protein